MSRKGDEVQGKTLPQGKTFRSLTFGEARHLDRRHLDRRHLVRLYAGYECAGAALSKGRKTGERSGQNGRRAKLNFS